LIKRYTVTLLQHCRLFRYGSVSFQAQAVVEVAHVCCVATRTRLSRQLLLYKHTKE